MDNKERRALLQEKLKLFTPTSVYGHFGIETNYGWDQLLINTLDRIQELLEAENIPLTNFYVAQIKEKFGTLRFYWSISIPEELEEATREGIYNRLESIIDSAESASGSLCEKCAIPGRDCNPNGWILTLCAECEDKVKKNFKEGWVP